MNSINLSKDHSVFKVSMGPKDIDDTAFHHFMDKGVIVVHGKTKAMAKSSMRQGDIFKNEMEINDYFYLCRGNDNFVLTGSKSQINNSEIKEFKDVRTDLEPNPFSIIII